MTVAALASRASSAPTGQGMVWWGCENECPLGVAPLRWGVARTTGSESSPSSPPIDRQFEPQRTTP